MAKPIKVAITLQLPAGAATAAPPVGTALGPHGINIGDFVKRYNEATKEKSGDIIPVAVTIYEDRSFDFTLKTPPASDLLRKAAGAEKGSGTPNKAKVGSISQAELAAIAAKKMADLNADSPEAAARIIAGTARSMGLDITP